MNFFENRSFHKHRPKKFRLKYLNIPSKRTPRENLLHSCKAVFFRSKSSFCVRSPPCCCRKKFVFQHRPKRWCEKMLPSERIFRVWKRPNFAFKRRCQKNATMWTYFPILKIANFSTSPQEGDAMKCYHVNILSCLKMANFFDIAF